MKVRFSKVRFLGKLSYLYYRICEDQRENLQIDMPCGAEGELAGSEWS